MGRKKKENTEVAAPKKPGRKKKVESSYNLEDHCDQVSEQLKKSFNKILKSFAKEVIKEYKSSLKERC